MKTTMRCDDNEDVERDLDSIAIESESKYYIGLPSDSSVRRI